MMYYNKKTNNMEKYTRRTVKGFIRKLVVPSVLAVSLGSASNVMANGMTDIKEGPDRAVLEASEITAGVKMTPSQDPNSSDSIELECDCVYWDGYGYTLYIDEDGDNIYDTAAYADTFGNILIEPDQYRSISFDGYGYQVVSGVSIAPNMYLAMTGYLDPSFNCIVDPFQKYASIECFGDHLLVLDGGGSYGLFDMKGNPVTDIVYRLIECEYIDGKFEYTLYTTEGTMKLEDVTSNVVGYVEPASCLDEPGTVKYIEEDTDGDGVADYSSAYYVDAQNRIMIEPDGYSDIVWTGNGFRLMKYNWDDFTLSTEGFADKTGKIIVPTGTYYSVSYDGYGYEVSKMQEDERGGCYSIYGYLDKDFNEVVGLEDCQGVYRIGGDKLIIRGEDDNYKILPLIKDII